MELKILAKNTIFLASPKVLKFLIGIIRSKLVAIFLGTTGVGIINQLQTIIRQFSAFTISSMPDGLVKLIAEENGMNGDKKVITDIIKTYLLMIFPLTVIVTILGYIFADQVTMFVFGDIQYKLYFQIGFSALPISILSTSAFALLKAYKKIKSIALAEMLIIIVNLVLFVPLIYFYKTLGGVIYVALSYFVTFFIYRYFAKRDILKIISISVKDIANSEFKHKYFKELLSFMGIGLVLGTYMIYVELSIRSIVINQMGLDGLGIYTPILAWSSLFVGFILPSLKTYLFPRISEAKSDNEIVSIINDVIRLMTFITLPFIIIGISLRHLIVPLFYSSEFMEATIYLPFHFSALLFIIWKYAFDQIFAPTGRLKSLFVFAVIHHTLALILAYFLIPSFGLYGYMISLTIPSIISLFLYIIFFKTTIKFKLNVDNVRLVSFALVAVSALILLRNYRLYLIFTSIILISALYFLLRKQERDFIMNKLKRR